MSHDAIIIAAMLLPFVVMVLLKINAVMVFLSLCLGDVLVRYVADEANSLFGLFSAHISKVSTSTVQLALLLAPAVVTCALMVLSVNGRGRTLLNVLPAAGASMLGILFAVPLLPPGAAHSIEAQALWRQLSQAQALIIGVSAFISLAFLWTQRRGKSAE